MLGSRDGSPHIERKLRSTFSPLSPALGMCGWVCVSTHMWGPWIGYLFLLFDISALAGRKNKKGQMHLFLRAYGYKETTGPSSLFLFLWLTCGCLGASWPLKMLYMGLHLVLFFSPFSSLPGHPPSLLKLELLDIQAWSSWSKSSSFWKNPNHLFGSPIYFNCVKLFLSNSLFLFVS